MRYSLAHSPDTIRLDAASSNLDAPAIQPARSATYIDIVMPCGTVVRVLPVEGKHHIRCIDVLRTLHQHLLTRLPREEYERFCAARPADAKIAVDRAFFARVDAIRDPTVREHVKSQGVLRIDLLMGKTRFGGLLRRPAPQEWKLQVLPAHAAPSS